MLKLDELCQKKVVKNRVGGWLVNSNLTNVCKYTVVFFTLPHQKFQNFTEQKLHIIHE